MEFIRKLFAALIFLFIVLPIGIAVISDVTAGTADVAGTGGLASAGLALWIVSFVLWRRDGFMREVKAVLEKYEKDGAYEIPGDLETKVSLMKYRRTGQFVLPMFRQRVKLWKGASFSVNAGQVSAPKDWMKEESGTLTLGDKHLIYMGSRSNKKMTWRSIVSMSADRGVIEVQQSNRGAIRWQGRGITPEFVAAANLLWMAAEVQEVS